MTFYKDKTRSENIKLAWKEIYAYLRIARSFARDYNFNEAHLRRKEAIKIAEILRMTGYISKELYYKLSNYTEYFIMED